MPPFDRRSFIAIKVKVLEVIFCKKTAFSLLEGDFGSWGKHLFLEMFVGSLLPSRFEELGVPGGEGVQIVICYRVAKRS